VQERLGSVQPEVVSAAAARTSPSATLYFIRDTTTPFMRRNTLSERVIIRVVKFEMLWDSAKIALIFGPTD
jgi:hypothetical protein